MRYFLELSYKGTKYCGWQRQINAISIQAEVEEKLTYILKEPIEIIGAGRTDTGVHALQTFAHFDCKSSIPEDILHKFNSFLDADIVAKNIFPVKDNSHARFNALSRTYKYQIVTKKNAFLTDTTYFFKKPLNIEAMNTACQYLLGEKDFKCFSKMHTDVTNFYCTISEAFWEKQNDIIVFNITANRFLRNMVRAIVGTLIEIGINKTTPHQLPNIILSKDRKNAGYSVPAKGLFLKNVVYKKSLI